MLYSLCNYFDFLGRLRTLEYEKSKTIWESVEKEHSRLRDRHKGLSSVMDMRSWVHNLYCEKTLMWPDFFDLFTTKPTASQLQGHPVEKSHMDGCGCLNSGDSSDTAVRSLEHQENGKCNQKLNKKVLYIPHLRTLCGISLMDPFNSVNIIVYTIRNCILRKSREQVGSRCMEFWGSCQEYFVQLYSFPDTLLWIFSQLFLLSSYLHELCMTWPWFCFTFKEHFTLQCQSQYHSSWVFTFTTDRENTDQTTNTFIKARFWSELSGI